MKNKDLLMSDNKTLKEIATTLQFVLIEMRELRKELWETYHPPQRLKNSQQNKVTYRYIDQDEEDD